MIFKKGQKFKVKTLHEFYVTNNNKIKIINGEVYNQESSRIMNNCMTSLKEVEVEKQVTSNCFKAMGWFWEPWMLKLDDFESPILMKTE